MINHYLSIYKFILLLGHCRVHLLVNVSCQDLLWSPLPSINLPQSPKMRRPLLLVGVCPAHLTPSPWWLTPASLPVPGRTRLLFSCLEYKHNISKWLERHLADKGFFAHFKIITVFGFGWFYWNQKSGFCQFATLSLKLNAFYGSESKELENVNIPDPERKHHLLTYLCMLALMRLKF